jgi:hypothetical protein
LALLLAVFHSIVVLVNAAVVNLPAAVAAYGASSP